MPAANNKQTNKPTNNHTKTKHRMAALLKRQTKFVTVARRLLMHTVGCRLKFCQRLLLVAFLKQTNKQQEETTTKTTTTTKIIYTLDQEKKEKKKENKKVNLYNIFYLSNNQKKKEKKRGKSETGTTETGGS